MMKPLSLTLLALSLPLLGSGCASSSNTAAEEGDALCVEACDDGPSLLAVLPESTVIASLNKDQLVEFCEVRKAFHSEFLTLQTDPSLNCTAQGLDLVFQEDADVAACEAERAACIEAAGEQPTFELLQCLAYQVSSTQMQGCQASLADYEACTQSLLERAQTLIETLNCNITLEEAAVFQAQDNSALPPACDPIIAACPPLLDELEEGPDDAR